MINHYATVNLFSREALPFEGGTVQGVCVYVCVCVCVCVCVWLCPWLRAKFKPHSGNFPFGFPYASRQSTQLALIAGVQIQGLSHETAMVQVGLWVATPLAVRKGLFSCEYLAWLQELCLHGSQCLLSAQASWVCQVCMTA